MKKFYYIDKANTASSYVDISCTFSEGLLVADLTAYDVLGSCTTDCPSLLIPGLQNPTYEGSYAFSCLIFGTGSSTVSQIFHSACFIITKNYFSTNMNIHPLVRLNNEKTLLIFDFKVN